MVNIPKDRNEQPESWKRIVCKRYDLFKPIPLQQSGGFLFKEILSKRRSSVGYILENVLTLEKLSSILHCGYGLQGGSKEEKREAHRTVPSGGQRYPLEVYIFLFKQIDSCLPGIYHYGVMNHVLEPIILAPFSRKDILSFVPEQEWLQDTNAMICLTSVFRRTVEKYGSRGYRYILLEAGHVAQNMLLAGAENNVNLIPLGAIEEAAIERSLGLSSGEEKVVYALFL